MVPAGGSQPAARTKPEQRSPPASTTMVLYLAKQGMSLSGPVLCNGRHRELISAVYRGGAGASCELYVQGDYQTFGGYCRNNAGNQVYTSAKMGKCSPFVQVIRVYSNDDGSAK
jgi:hypothetical protein